MKCNTDRSNNLAFNEVAELYDQIRPGYPTALYKEVLSYVRKPESIRALEIGCGTGQATVPFAQSGMEILAIEPGNNLADIARENARRYEKVSVLTASFENANLQANSFDLVYSATAFHWIPAEIAYSKSNRILTPGGTLAVFWNLMPQFSNAFKDSVSTILSEFEPALIQSTFGKTSSEAITEGFLELQATGLFTEEMQKTYDWKMKFDAAAFTRLLRTFANYQVLSAEVQQSLYPALERSILRNFDGIVEVSYSTVLNLARKKI